ncbi:MAG TPA: cell wall metabolism sensor histidine kinase WalK [Desulfitobacterium dehalogenans]|uniref:histidine kinase n=1 Tax=Desulfitobacterium dehalogenans TaxID=36854 RepID=A0A7C6Z314_9FIRM|nr:cell wall metabolism sensor histidine kinase WalK [Desulfitobacterium dehalogenans]
MKIKWLVLGLYLLVNSLSILLFWLGAQVQTGIRMDIDVLAMILAILLPGGIVFFFASQFERRIRKINDAITGILQEEFRPAHHPEDSDELGTLSRAITNLGQQVNLSMLNNRQEAQKIQAILAGMQEGVISLDHVGRIVLLNRAAERLFGREQEAVRDKHFSELYGFEELEDLVTQALEKGISGQIELVTDSKLIIRAQVSPITGEKARSQGAVIVCYDITEIRRLELLRTEFVGNVSHELRTPLTSIKGFVETLLDGASEVPHLRERFLNIIHKETLRLQRLVDELLTLSRIENQRQGSGQGMSKVQEAYEKIRPVIEPYAEAKKIELEIKIPRDLPEVGIGIDLLSQVLLNLMENAVKYTVKGKVWLHAFHDDGKILLEFGDTGCGIPEGDLPRIFERFYRVDKARSREQGGTGLGLSIVKHIVEGVKGKITVASELGSGSVFICELPTGNGEKKNEEKSKEGNL